MSPNLRYANRPFNSANGPGVPGIGSPQFRGPLSFAHVKQAKALPFTFLTDPHDISHLPDWVKTPKQTIDGHLVELARASQAVLATLDEKVPGAYRIR
jgi:hypothetical protein